MKYAIKLKKISLPPGEPPAETYRVACAEKQLEKEYQRLEENKPVGEVENCEADSLCCSCRFGFVISYKSQWEDAPRLQVSCCAPWLNERVSTYCVDNCNGFEDGEFGPLGMIQKAVPPKGKSEGSVQGEEEEDDKHARVDLDVEEYLGEKDDEKVPPEDYEKMREDAGIEKALDEFEQEDLADIDGDLDAEEEGDAIEKALDELEREGEDDSEGGGPDPDDVQAIPDNEQEELAQPEKDAPRDPQEEPPSSIQDDLEKACSDKLEKAFPPDHEERKDKGEDDGGGIPAVPSADPDEEDPDEEDPDEEDPDEK